MNAHEKYLERCLQLAQNGVGNTYPNPLVGSVIVLDDRIIGEGWHQKAGEPHAEVQAIRSVSDKNLLKKATIYVNLEPCSHYGKTPPCSDLIIASGIKKVVIGTTDPNPKVAGKGIQKLMAAGCDVLVGVLEAESNFLNRRFFTFHRQKRPYIILKWAQTPSGFLAPINQKDRKPVWITNANSRQLVHKWRSEEQAILVGTTTAIKDNPKLDVRLWGGTSPVRVVLDKTLKLPENSHLLDGSIQTIVLCEKAVPNRDAISFETIHFEKELARQICAVLFRYNLQSLIVEGGSKTLQSFIDENLWDEARVFTGENEFKNGTVGPYFPNLPRSEENTTGDQLKIYRND